MNKRHNSKKLFNISFDTPKTLRERIYIHLRKAIINNYISAGDRIFEKEIANEFSVSITPVREAIFQLSMEGFVEIKTYKNIIIKGISLKEIKEIYEVQGALEGFAGRLSTLQLNDKHLVKMGLLIEKMEKYYELNDVDKFYAKNGEMHDIFIKQSGNQLINDLISKLNLRKKMFRYRVTFLSKKEIMKKAIEDHKEILKGFKSRDPNEVEKLIREHWKSDKRIKNFEIAIQKVIQKEQAQKGK